MIEEPINQDKIIGILRLTQLDKTASRPLLEVIEFVLDGININAPTDRLSSILVIAQKIFEEHPATLAEMFKQVIRSKTRKI